MEGKRKEWKGIQGVEKRNGKKLKEWNKGSEGKRKEWNKGM